MLVETAALSKRYGGVVALDGCSVAVERGEVFGLLGPNGSGKTTLLRLLLGYLRPSGGRASIAGFDCTRQSLEVRRRTTYLPGEARLFRGMRGRDVLRFFAQVRPGGDLRRSLAIAERLTLDLNRPVGQMSTGMRQKTALAAVMAADAAVVILDEPTSNLDPSARSEVLRLVGEARQEGKTVLFSSHVLGEVEATCDRVAILRQGKLAHQQVMHDLRRQHRIKARLTGPWPAVPEGLGGEVRVLRPAADEVTIETPGELSAVLGWLSTLPLAEMRIEPFSLQAVYDRFHGGNGA